MLSIKLLDTEMWEAKTVNGVSLVPDHVTTFEEDLKKKSVCQDSPKDVLTDSGLELSWSFHSLQIVVLKIVLNNLSSVKSCIIINQNEIVTNSTSMVDIWIKDLIPIFYIIQISSIEHMQVNVATE
ncbi:uncharacterized protein TNCV_898461 [Trichonephila clavipes]|nr:uncharacterized protein TNCV_898461 [Trichonephila clavipes]